MVGAGCFSLQWVGISAGGGAELNLFGPSGKGGKFINLGEKELFLKKKLLQIVPFLLYFSQLTLRDSKGVKDVVERL